MEQRFLNPFLLCGQCGAVPSSPLVVSFAPHSNRPRFARSETVLPEDSRYWRKINVVLLGCFVTFVAVIPCAFAERPGRAMSKSAIQAGEKAAALSFGESIRQSNLIVIGEYLTAGKIVVKEVLKGDNSSVGSTIELPSPIVMGCRSQPVPDIKRMAVLLRKDLQKPNRVVEIYDLPDQLSLLRLLIPIYGKASEYDRLKALSQLFVNATAHGAIPFENDQGPALKQEFLRAIGDMREPANFDVVKRLYFDPAVEAKDKLTLQQWIAETGDPRALPILYEAMKSKDRFIVSDAVCKLIYYFQDDGIDPALANAFNSAPADVRPTIGRYLLQRGCKIPNIANMIPVQTPFQKAEELNQSGRLKEAAAIYLSILESKENNGYVLRAAALNALKSGDPALRARILKSRIEWLNHDAATGNYLEATDTARVLRKLHDHGSLAGLTAILSKRDFVFAKPNRIATMAILDLGHSACKEAADSLLKEISASGSLANNEDEQLRWLLEFAWLKQPGQYDTAAKLIAEKPSWSNAWKIMQPLMRGLPCSDEGLFLVQTLKEPQSLPQQALDWVIYRLGDLHEKRAVDSLIALFIEKIYSFSSVTVSEALKTIAGDQVIRSMESIALTPESPCQANAVEVLADIQREKSLPTLRKIFKNGKLDTKVRVLGVLSQYGTCDDRETLMPMFNYWTGDRAIHYWLLQTISGIEQRCHCKPIASKSK